MPEGGMPERDVIGGIMRFIAKRWAGFIEYRYENDIIYF
jgi:hypothetical protein